MVKVTGQWWAKPKWLMYYSEAMGSEKLEKTTVKVVMKMGKRTKPGGPQLVWDLAG